VREYLVYYENQWWHFFMKPFYGLCYRKKEGVHFRPFEVLIKEACEDFCVLSAGGKLHLVCQDKEGNILYIDYDGTDWRKRTLLTSREEKPYPKYFSLISMSGYLNLFYTIIYRERCMLIHQMLDIGDKPPAVVDYIRPARPPFLLTGRSGEEMILLYENESGVSGGRRYRWSQKSFGGFVPTHPEAGCRICAIHVEPDGRERYAGFSLHGEICNLIYFEKKAEGTFTEPVTVYLDCPPDAHPVFCYDDEKFCLVWEERGAILAASSEDSGKKWSKPMRYLKGSSVQPVLFCVGGDGKPRYAYGYSTEAEVSLYVMPDLIEPARQTKYNIQAVKAQKYRAESTDRREESNYYAEELAVMKRQLSALQMKVDLLLEKLGDNMPK